MFLFSFFGIVVFLVLTLNQNQKSPPRDDGWVDFSSSINSIWDKAVSHIVGIAEFLQPTTKKGNWWHQKRSFPTPTHGRGTCGWFLHLLFECTLFGGNCLWMKPKFPNLHFICFCPFTGTMLTVLLGNGWQAQIIEDNWAFSGFTITYK